MKKLMIIFQLVSFIPISEQLMWGKGVGGEVGAGYTQGGKEFKSLGLHGFKSCGMFALGNLFNLFNSGFLFF